MYVVQLTDLYFAYKGGKPLFERLELSLSGGNIYGLLGKNGAGKTTLLKIMCGVLFADAGSSTVLGCDSRRRSPAFLRELFFIPEEFYVPPITAEAYRACYSPFYPRFNREAFESYLGEFDLCPSDRLATLSYGNKKKFLIAFGLATECRLLILDEPTNGLDIPTKSQFRKLIAGSLTDERAFIISTHQVRDMENLIDPIIIIDSGRIVFQQPIQKIIEKLAVREVQDPETIDPVVFAEKSFSGYTVVTRNTDESESRIDLELLFKTVTANSKECEAIFGEGAGQ